MSEVPVSEMPVVPVEESMQERLIENLKTVNSDWSRVMNRAEEGEIEVIEHEDGLMRIECPIEKGSMPPLGIRIKEVNITKNMKTIIITLAGKPVI